MINPGELKDKITLLILRGLPDSYAWEEDTCTWGKVEYLKGPNLLFRGGRGEATVKILLRKRPLTLNHAIRLKGKHGFLIGIRGAGEDLMEATAVLVEPKACVAQVLSQPALDNLNRPVYCDAAQLTFPGFLLEKYASRTQDEPMSLVKMRYRLITPKAIELVSGQGVKADGLTYTVEVPHTLSTYKNEYEIIVRRNP